MQCAGLCPRLYDGDSLPAVAVWWRDRCEARADDNLHGRLDRVPLSRQGGCAHKTASGGEAPAHVHLQADLTLDALDLRSLIFHAVPSVRWYASHLYDGTMFDIDFFLVVLYVHNGGCRRWISC